MSSSNRNRGKNTGDDKLFGASQLSVLTEAVNDHCYLLSRGYGSQSALELAGNRYRLNKRQREAILRISSSKEEIIRRKIRECNEPDLLGNSVEIDGFNLLIILESMLSGAYIFHCRDGTFRDISGVHGSYKKVAKTGDAIIMTGRSLCQLGVESVKWYLDAPVSNSGRLKTLLLDIGNENSYNWEVELINSPDHELAKSSHIVITSDGWILDRVKKWFNLTAYIINHQSKATNIVDI